MRKLISEGKLNAERIGTQWVVSQEQLQAYIDEYDVLIEPDDHERLDDDIPEIVALSFSLVLWDLILAWRKAE